jgi:hypothetical protein
VSDDASLVRLQAGGIVEVCVRRAASVSFVESVQADVAAALMQAGRDAILCTDLRSLPPMLPEALKAFSRAMRQNNGSILCSAILVDPANEILKLQLERIVRCAGNPNRRLFTSADALRDWVAMGCAEARRRTITECFGPEAARLASANRPPHRHPE